MRSILVLALLSLFAPPALAQYYLPTYRYANPDDLQNQVANWYRRFLNREPDPGGLATWVEGLRSGNSPERTLASILGSPEYYAKSGNTPDGFIHTLYRDLLGREPTESEFAFWLRRMYHQDRTDVAYAFLMRYPQSWQSSPAIAEPPDAGLYEYRRPFWHNWHEEYRDRYRRERRDRERP
jgi:Domain of unknown function (DUF4214)